MNGFLHFVWMHPYQHTGDSNRSLGNEQVCNSIGWIFFSESFQHRGIDLDLGSSFCDILVSWLRGQPASVRAVYKDGTAPSLYMQATLEETTIGEESRRTIYNLRVGCQWLLPHPRAP